MDYSESLRDILIKKIIKAERDLYQLKLDYCRFVFGISHRSKVNYENEVYQIKAVNLDSMHRIETGEWSKPAVSGVKVLQEATADNDEVFELDARWELVGCLSRSQIAQRLN